MDEKSSILVIKPKDFLAYVDNIIVTTFNKAKKGEIVLQKAFRENKTASSAVRNGFLTNCFQENASLSYRVISLQNGKTVLIKIDKNEENLDKQISGLIQSKIQEDNVKDFILDLCNMNCIDSVRIAGLVAVYSLIASDKAKINVVVKDIETKKLIKTLNPGNLKINLINSSLVTLASA